MLTKLIASFALLCLSIHAKPQDFEAYVLCADVPENSNVNVHYLHPLRSSTINPIDPKHPPHIDYNETESRHLFNTRRHGWVANLVHSERRNNPLINWNTDMTEQYVSLNLTDNVLTLDWAFTTTTGVQSRLTYLQSTDQYWGFTGSNNIGENGDVYVLSIYRDVIGSDFDGTAVFNTSWIPGDSELVMNLDITSDSANQQLFIAVANTGYTSSTGSILTYDIAQNKLVSNVTYGGDMRIKYSTKRKTMFSAQLQYDQNGAHERIGSIEEVDPHTGKSRVIIDGKNLPELYGQELDSTFDDLSGEWYFVWTIANQNVGSGSWFFSVNVDTKKVTLPVELVADWQRTQFLGLVVEDVTPRDTLAVKNSWQ